MDIVKRLRERDRIVHPNSPETARTIKDAADEIESLQRGLDACAVDNEQYEQANNALNAEIERLRRKVEDYKHAKAMDDAEIERLRAALEKVVDSIYCNDGYRNVSISEEAEKTAREALKDE